MHTRQSKRKRPNLDTAYEWLKDGWFSVSPTEHYQSDRGRESEIKRTTEEILNVSRQFPSTRNLEYAVLKGHLIVEHVVTQYIRCNSRVVVGLDDIRLSFSQKLDIAYLMGLGVDDPVLLPGIQLLNKARNQVAHSFCLNRDIVDELIRIFGDPEDPFLVENDKHRVSGLRKICRWICGYTAGRIEGEYYAMKFKEEEKSEPK